MMTNDDYRHFVCIVAGENPDKLMKPYDKGLVVEPYVVYKSCDAEKIKESMIMAYKQQIAELDEDDVDEREELEEELRYTSGLSPQDAFSVFTYYYERDPKTGDAISSENPKGKWDVYNIGRNFSIPFYTNEGLELYQCRKDEVNWSVMNGNGKEFYAKVWDMVMEGAEPSNERELGAYTNMKDKQYYFQKFETKEMYVASNTAFWGYAFLSEETGWVELVPSDNQFVWMTQYYDRFMKDLPGNTKLTIYECRRF